MSSTKLYYCMQANNGTHCSFNVDLPNRIQCDTCHDYERQEAANKANFYGKNPSISMIETGQEDDPLGAIAHICRSLTYGEMMTLGAEIFAALEEYEDTHDPNPMAKAIHKWSKNYGMDTNINSSSSAVTNTINTINDLLESDKRES